MLDALMAHFHRLERILRRRGQSREDAEDLIQETFLRVKQYLDKGNEIREPEAYQDDALYDDAKVRRFFPPPVLDRRRASQWTPSDERYTRAQAAAALAIARAGGEVCVGSHGNFAGVGFHWNLRAMQEGGWQPMEALRAATMCGARGMGLAQDIGSLEPAKLADLLVLNANPLEDLRHSAALRYVIKNGFVYEADTLRMIWPEVREAPRFWW
ncbi:amidohydrolase family protein [Peristeroidobacter soli]|uniref:amidohydrolase family protein n=1 Tax=Peristeroidobacter soli TaxID=2497877 RepID=UPI00101BDEEB|nr:amidohydrolase family protein [Peristeroidobacter soli]